MEGFLFQCLLFIIPFVLSLAISSIVIRKLLPLFNNPKVNKPEQNQRVIRAWYIDIGFWIGFFETLIIFIFVANNEFSGLAIIFAAKEFVRKEEIKKDPVYYLLGTLINFGVALLMAEIGMRMVQIY